MRIVRYCFTVCALLVLASSTQAQVVPQGPAFPVRRAFNHSYPINPTDAGGLTVWFIEPMFVRPGLSFSAAYGYPKARPGTPAVVQLSFAFARRVGPAFERNRNLTFLLDQMRQLPLGMMEYDVDNNMVRLFVPLDIFLEIANAGSVSGQVGDAAFQLDVAMQEALRDLASRMAP